MNRSNMRLLALAGTVATLGLAACHNNDRTDDYAYRDSGTSRDAYTDHDRRYDPNYQADHRTYDRTVHDNPTDRGSGDVGSTSFNRLTGNLKTTVDAGMDRVYQASEKALNDMHYVITDKKMEDTKSVIEAKSADKDTVKITLDRRTDRLTDAMVGVGMTGKQSTADLILEKIVENLK